jgi:hypothetical protein
MGRRAVPPALLLSLLLVLLSALALHAAVGRTLRGLGLFVLAALTGFVLGETVARALAQDRGMLGPVHLTHGLVGAWLTLLVARRRVA